MVNPHARRGGHDVPAPAPVTTYSMGIFRELAEEPHLCFCGTVKALAPLYGSATPASRRLRALVSRLGFRLGSSRTHMRAWGIQRQTQVRIPGR